MDSFFSTEQENVLDPCWKTIGIQGDRSCDKLRRHTHCRNCEVFADAAARLRDQFQPLSWFDASEAEAPEVNQQHPDATQHLLFRLGAQWFALPSRVLDFIISPVQVRKVPNRHSATLLGVCNVRGQLLPWVSLHKLLKIDETGTDAAKARLLVLNHSSGHLVSQADEILGIHKLEPGFWLTKPNSSDQLLSQLTLGLGRYQQLDLTLLDAQALMQAMLEELQ
ncbi:chemotaxis protein CheW [Rheinheimera sp.]|uniref:chemotaxis protein CheW n=1 Tax=Rheinheimera sp. TaxID=1869214 RepID=UPI00307D8715